MRIQPSSLYNRLREEYENKHWKIIPVTINNYTQYGLNFKWVEIGPFYTNMYDLVKHPDFIVNIYVNKYAKKSYLYVRDTKNGYVGRVKLVDGTILKREVIPHILPLNTWMCESQQKRIYKETKEKMIAEDTKKYGGDANQYKDLYDEIATLTRDKEYYKGLAEREIQDKKYLEDIYNERYMAVLEGTGNSLASTARANLTKSDEQLLEDLKIKLSDIPESELLEELVRRIPTKPKPKSKPKDYIIDFQSKLEKELTNESTSARKVHKRVCKKAAVIRNKN